MAECLSGIAVTVTVEGLYQNLRHFIRNIETANSSSSLIKSIAKATENNTTSGGDAASQARADRLSVCS